MSKSGFNNEKDFINSLNNKQYLQINDNLKKFLVFACKRNIENNEFIRCRKDGPHDKSDVIVEVNNYQSFRVSIKSGFGNSVHQETIDEFIHFLIDDYSINNELERDLRFYIWGDLTVDGKGLLSDRMSASQIEKEYPEKVERIKSFFESHKKQLIARFITGKNLSAIPDFIYYGTPADGVWANSSDVVGYLASIDKRGIGVGGLNFQAWNRAIKKDSKSESKRGVIQMKWPSIKRDILLISNNE